MTTTSVGMLLPSFKEDFGENRMVDIVGTLSKSFISEKIDITDSTGIHIEDNGNVRLTVNIGA